MDKSKKIFLNALDYDHAATTLNILSRSDNIQLYKPSYPNKTLERPSFVNSALALELLFKCLYRLENNGKDYKDKRNRFSHDFYEIYNKLKAKNSIKQQFDQKISVLDMSNINKLGIKISTNLEEVLKNWSSVFIKLRYYYENIGTVIQMMFYPELRDILMLEIFAICSEWQTLLANQQII